MKVRISAKTLVISSAKNSVEMTASQEAKLLASVDDTLARYAKLEAKYAALDAEAVELEAKIADQLRKLGKVIMDNKDRLMDLMKKIKVPKLDPAKKKAILEKIATIKRRIMNMSKRRDAIKTGKATAWKVGTKPTSEQLREYAAERVRKARK